MIKNFITGFFVGLANIIPGVSGGTFLLIFGIYEKTIGAINGALPAITGQILPALPKLLRPASFKEGQHTIGASLKESNLGFLLTIMLGAGICILALGELMKYLLENQFAPTYGLFFGFILVSVAIPLRLIKKFSPMLILFFAIGVGSTVAVTASVNPYDKVAGKSEIYLQRLKAQPEKSMAAAYKAQNESKRLKFTGEYTVGEYVYAAVSGAVAVSAMVLPGISGSLVLILMGQYFEVVSAISGLKTLQLDFFLFLGILALGMVVGILGFAKLVEYVFAKFHDTTMAVLTGLIVGSLYALWPFKLVAKLDGYVKVDGTITLVKNMAIHTNKNVPPPDLGTLIPVLLTGLAGVVIMLIMLKFEPKGEN